METGTIIWGRWCGQKEAPPRITSNTNAVKVTFKSDDYFVVKPGFKLYYSLVVSVTYWNIPIVTLPIILTDGPAGCVDLSPGQRGGQGHVINPSRKQ